MDHSELLSPSINILWNGIPKTTINVQTFLNSLSPYYTSTSPPNHSNRYRRPKSVHKIFVFAAVRCWLLSNPCPTTAALGVASFARCRSAKPFSLAAGHDLAQRAARELSDNRRGARRSGERARAPGVAGARVRGAEKRNSQIA